MDIAFVQDAKHDIDGEQCGGDEHWLIVQRLLKDRGGTLKISTDRRRHTELTHLLFDCHRCLTERDPGRKIERDRRCDKEILMVDRERGIACAVMREG